MSDDGSVLYQKKKKSLESTEVKTAHAECFILTGEESHHQVAWMKLGFTLCWNQIRFWYSRNVTKARLASAHRVCRFISFN